MLLHSLAAVLLGAAGRAELFLEAGVAALSERARHALRRHWEGNPRARKPRFLVNDEMLASMPLLREGLCRFEGRFRAARPPRRARRRPFGVVFVGDSTMRNLFHALCLAMNVRQRGDDQGAQPVATCAGRLAAPAARARRRRGECGCAEEAAFRATRECGCAGSLLLGPDVAAAYAGSTDVDPRAVGRAAGALGGPVDAVVFGAGLRGNQAVTSAVLRTIAETFVSLHAIEPLRSRGRRRVDGAGRPKFDCHVGAGLWLQWPTPFAPAPAAWTSYAGFVGYEAALRRAAGQYARDAPGATVVASTTHSQCDAAFTRDFRRVADEARRRGREAASAGCAAWLRDRFGDVDAARHCAAGLRGRDASAALNARLRSALPDVDVVDAFALTDGRCEENLPGDAMHFHGLLYDELTLVLEALGWRPTARPVGCPRARRGWNASSAAETSEAPRRVVV